MIKFQPECKLNLDGPAAAGPLAGRGPGARGGRMVQLGKFSGPGSIVRKCQ